MTDLELKSASLIFWLCSNPKGEPRQGAIPVKLKPWLLPAWWVIVRDDVPDETIGRVRPLTAGQHLRIAEAEYRQMHKPPQPTVKPSKPPRPFA